MKKITKISLITAGISILLGVIFIFIGFVVYMPMDSFTQKKK